MARCTLRDYQDLDWAVWFCETYLIASYDSSHSLYDRRTGQQIYHGYSLDAVKAATPVPDDTEGETYAMGY